MSETQQAWALWHLLQNLSDILWNRYESAFLDFCIEEDKDNQYRAVIREELPDNELPF